jgi:predicted nuclease of restriction endonuclease-like RecB superfamily
MRQGVLTIKPDSNVRKFLTEITKRTFSDKEAVDVLERVAKELGIRAKELDWSIWDYQSNKN